MITTLVVLYIVANYLTGGFCWTKKFLEIEKPWKLKPCKKNLADIFGFWIVVLIWIPIITGRYLYESVLVEFDSE